MVRNRIDQWSQVDNNMPVVKHLHIKHRWTSFALWCMLLKASYCFKSVEISLSFKNMY